MGMREEFEFWQCESDEGPHTDPIWMIYDAAGNYGIAEIQRDWVIWRASRAALVVELPDSVANTGTLTSTAVLSYKRECSEAIRVCGIKVKP